jgi:hypothetical protein
MQALIIFFNILKRKHMQAKEPATENLTTYWKRLEQLLDAIVKQYPVNKFGEKDKSYKNAIEKLKLAIDAGKKLEQPVSTSFISKMTAKSTKELMHKIDNAVDNLSSQFSCYSQIIDIISPASYTLAYHYLSFMHAYYNYHEPALNSASELKTHWAKNLEGRKSLNEAAAKYMANEIQKYKYNHASITPEITNYRNPYPIVEFNDLLLKAKAP